LLKELLPAFFDSDLASSHRYKQNLCKQRKDYC